MTDSSVEAVARAMERIQRRLSRYEEGLRVKAFEVGDNPISDEHAADLRILLAALPSPEREPMREALAFACAALREVGDDYPGSSCQKWCYEKAAEAERMGAR